MAISQFLSFCCYQQQPAQPASRGPNVVVNRGHGASISFDEPVYQAKVFDISKLMIEEIPPQGTQTLILTEVEASQFPGLPQTPTTSLLANTLQTAATSSTCRSAISLFTTPLAPYLKRALTSPRLRCYRVEDNIDIAALRTGYTSAVEQHGTSNSFLLRVEQFLALVDNGTSQRLAAQQAGVDWSHLNRLSGQPDLSHLLDNSFDI